MVSNCLENPRDGGAGWAAISGVAQSRTRLKRLSSSSSSQYSCLGNPMDREAWQATVHGVAKSSNKCPVSPKRGNPNQCPIRDEAEE